MRILSILPTFKNETAYNGRINIGFINRLSRLCDYIPIQAYDKDSIVYDAKTLYEKYKPDAILLLAHADTLEGYLKGVPCLKVMIAVDYYKIVQRKKYYWYKSNEFDLVVQRHVYDTKHFSEHIGVPSVWLPYSASHWEFKPYDSWSINKVGFMGTVNERSYPVRFKAINALEKEGLIDNKGRVVSSGYADNLRKYKSMLTSTNHFVTTTPHAKFFEIIASGSVALTNSFQYWNVLFPDGKCWVEYKDDCSDIVEKAKEIISNDKMCIQLRNEAYRSYIKYHTDDGRIRELYNEIDNMLGGRPLNKRWSI